MQENRKELLQILSRLSLWYRRPAIKLANHLREEHNYSDLKIAKILGTTKQHVNQSYRMEDA